jgi:hypothetical protein
MATQHLHNVWNENRKVQVSRDGQVSGTKFHILQQPCFDYKKEFQVIVCFALDIIWFVKIFVCELYI